MVDCNSTVKPNHKHMVKFIPYVKKMMFLEYMLYKLYDVEDNITKMVFQC